MLQNKPRNTLRSVALFRPYAPTCCETLWIGKVLRKVLSANPLNHQWKAGSATLQHFFSKNIKYMYTHTCTHTHIEQYRVDVQSAALRRLGVA
jgi:hypothetical protein